MDESGSSCGGSSDAGSVGHDQCLLCKRCTSASDDVMTANCCGQKWHCGCFLLQLDKRKKELITCSCGQQVTVATRKFFPEGRSDGDAISSAWPDADTAPVEEELTGPAVTNLCARAKAGDLPDGSLAISMHWVHATDGLRTADVLCTPDACGTDGEMRGGLLLLIQLQVL